MAEREPDIPPRNAPCLGAAKHEAQKLIDILIQDFGYSPSEEMTVNFSGNRGYHVHVRSPNARGLDQLARREVVDYILGIGIQAEFQGLIGRRTASNQAVRHGGWRGRSTKALYDFVAAATQEDVKVFPGTLAQSIRFAFLSFWASLLLSSLHFSPLS